MKVFPFVLFACLLLSLSACQPKNLPTVMTIQGDHIVCKVSHQTTQSELTAFTKKLLEKNIVLDLTGTQYLEGGTLKQLQFAVMFPDGTIGTAAADIVGLQYRYYGFEFNPSAAVSFRAGSFE